MTEPGQRHSDLAELVRRNGDFRKNWGIVIGGLLYLRTLSAARGRAFDWIALIFGLIAATFPWAARLAWQWL